MKLRLSPRSVLKRLLALILILLVANVLAIILRFHSDALLARVYIKLFDFNQEANLPTVYSTLALFGTSIILLYIFRIRYNKGCRFWTRWLLLSLVFGFLALDEIASIHERSIVPLREALELSGIWYYSWLIPYALATLVLGLAYLHFIIKLPGQIRAYFFLSFSLFVGGAVGMELIGGRHHDLFGDQDYLYAIYYTSEELLEMVGIAVFIYTLLRYTAAHAEVSQPLQIHINLGRDPGSYGRRTPPVGPTGGRPNWKVHTGGRVSMSAEAMEFRNLPPKLEKAGQV